MRSSNNLIFSLAWQVYGVGNGPAWSISRGIINWWFELLSCKTCSVKNDLTYTWREVEVIAWAINLQGEVYLVMTWLAYTYILGKVACSTKAIDTKKSEWIIHEIQHGMIFRNCEEGIEVPSYWKKLGKDNLASM